jgi:starch synthase (maltosyl-transferring)
MEELDGRRRVIIEGVQPEVDCGLFPAKRVVGDQVIVEADIFADGHDQISAVVQFRHASEKTMRESRMTALVNDRWRAEFTADQLGFYLYTIEAWIDHFLTWRRDLAKRDEADFDVQLEIGLEMVREAHRRAKGRDKKKLLPFTKAEHIEDLQSLDLLDLMWRNSERRFASRYSIEVMIEVDRKRAEFSTWYELFPRSAGTLRDVERQLPRIAKMGFDVLYLPPVHPIGTTFRKGKNNEVSAAEGDVGSPWAIGGEAGGHKSIHPDLGTIDDFEELVAIAAKHGIEIALDIAFQASPDHPYVQEHPEWFLARPDGTIQYAENPPKKYQDIYPFHFESEGWQELWSELSDVFRFWAGKGVRIFRVDNPHTKAMPFWHWCIRALKCEFPDAIFLAEAFTRPKIMYWLAKGGFTQSYTYFAWRNTKYDLTEYFEEITKPPVSDFFRPNAWPNTPDILTEYLQYGGRAAFVIRLILAATLSSNYGIYGPAFEQMVHIAREPGSEEYLDSEKYEIKNWGAGEDDLSELIALINRIRRENPALQQNLTLQFHETDNEQVICYSKSLGENVIVTVVSLDTHNTQSAWVDLSGAPAPSPAGAPQQAHDLLTGARHTWRGPRNYVQLNPHVMPAHIFRIRRKVRTEHDFEYYL